MNSSGCDQQPNGSAVGSRGGRGQPKGRVAGGLTLASPITAGLTARRDTLATKRKAQVASGAAARRRRAVEAAAPPRLRGRGRRRRRCWCKWIAPHRAVSRRATRPHRRKRRSCDRRGSSPATRQTRDHRRREPAGNYGADWKLRLETALHFGNWPGRQQLRWHHGPTVTSSRRELAAAYG